MSKLTQNRILRTVSSVTGLIILTKLLGFAKQMVTASTFGATIETDLINLSQGFIGDIQYVLVQVLVTSLVTIYIYTSQQGEDTARRFVGQTLKAFTLVTGGVAAVVAIAAPWIARLIAPSYARELTAQLADYLRLFSPVLVLFAWIAIFQALLTAKKRFLPGEMVGFFQSIILIGTVVLLAPWLGVQTLVVGFFAYSIWNVFYLGFLSKKHWQLAAGNPFIDPAVQQLLKMLPPLLLGYSIVYVNQQVDKILVSGLETGAVTALGYAAVLTNLVNTFIVSFGSILFSYTTTHISQGEEESAANMAVQVTLLLVLAFLPISVLTILCSKDIVTIAFGRGAFGEDGIRMAAAGLAGYGFTFVPLVLREVFSRFQYGYQDSKRPMVNSSIGILFNIALSIILCPRFGVFGVAFASSVSVCICGILNMITARKHNTFLRYGIFMRTLPLLLAGGLVCWLIGRWSIGFWAQLPPIARFPLTTLYACGGYFLVTSPLLIRLLRRRPVRS